MSLSLAFYLFAAAALLLLLLLLQLRCLCYVYVLQPYIASAAVRPSSVLWGLVTGIEPFRARSALLPSSFSKQQQQQQLQQLQLLQQEASCYPLSSAEQARCLIEIATDPNVLGRAWGGLTPFI